MPWVEDKDGKRVWVGGSYFNSRGLSNTGSWESHGERRVRRKSQVKARQKANKRTFWGKVLKG